MNSNLTLCVGTLLRDIDRFECSIARLFGTILTLVSIFSIVFSIRFIYWSYHHRYFRTRHYTLIISIIFSSMSVIIVISPSVFMQCLSCRRLCSPVYCHIEGFVSYLNGCVHMFMLMIISLIRCTTVLQTNIRQRFFEQHSLSTTILCWLFGLVFAIPPLFKLNRYMPEGIGLHCGLDWFDRSIQSQIYFILTFLFVYFLPLVILFLMNVYVYCLIRRLIYGVTTIEKSNLSENVSIQPPQSTSSSFRFSSTTTTQSDKNPSNAIVQPFSEPSVLFIRRGTETIQTRNMLRLNRLKADKRFALATIFIVSEYLLSWTPYAIVALFYLFNFEFIDDHSILMTICAFIAKISMILNPFIYIASVLTNQLRVILCLRTCDCPYCRVRRNVVVT